MKNKNLSYSLAKLQYYRKAWRNDKKIIVIESDDWGSIRTSTHKAYDQLLKDGYRMKASKYSLDTLETNDDLQGLFNVLTKHNDIKGDCVCFTANMIMANPDFGKIRESAFHEYLYESVETTLRTDSDRSRVQEIWNAGLNEGLFYPQVHARDHIRYWEWLRDLRSGKTEAVETFKFEMCGVPLACSKSSTSYYLPIYVDDFIFQKESIDQAKLIKEGFNLFKKIFNMESRTTVAPGIGWTKTTEELWTENGVRYIQGGFLQKHHKVNEIIYIPHYLGEKSRDENLSYLVRNCYFEPSDSTDDEYWRLTFKQIEQAFSMKVPAIISSHRVNYMGSINQKNRERGLRQLDILLTAVLKKWPDILFMNSKQLGDQISGTNDSL